MLSDNSDRSWLYGNVSRMRNNPPMGESIDVTSSPSFKYSKIHNRDNTGRKIRNKFKKEKNSFQNTIFPTVTPNKRQAEASDKPMMIRPRLSQLNSRIDQLSAPVKLYEQILTFNTSLLIISAFIYWKVSLIFASDIGKYGAADEDSFDFFEADRFSAAGKFAAWWNYSVLARISRTDEGFSAAFPHFNWSSIVSPGSSRGRSEFLEDPNFFIFDFVGTLASVFFIFFVNVVLPCLVLLCIYNISTAAFHLLRVDFGNGPSFTSKKTNRDSAEIKVVLPSPNSKYIPKSPGKMVFTPPQEKAGAKNDEFATKARSEGRATRAPSLGIFTPESIRRNVSDSFLKSLCNKTVNEVASRYNRNGVHSDRFAQDAALRTPVQGRFHAPSRALYDILSEKSPNLGIFQPASRSPTKKQSKTLTQIAGPQEEFPKSVGTGDSILSKYQRLRSLSWNLDTVKMFLNLDFQYGESLKSSKSSLAVTAINCPPSTLDTQIHRSILWSAKVLQWFMAKLEYVESRIVQFDEKFCGHLKHTGISIASKWSVAKVLGTNYGELYSQFVSEFSLNTKPPQLNSTQQRPNLFSYSTFSSVPQQPTSEQLADIRELAILRVWIEQVFQEYFKPSLDSSIKRAYFLKRLVRLAGDVLCWTTISSPRGVGGDKGLDSDVVGAYESNLKNGGLDLINLLRGDMNFNQTVGGVGETGDRSSMLTEKKSQHKWNSDEYISDSSLVLALVCAYMDWMMDYLRGGFDPKIAQFRQSKKLFSTGFFDEKPKKFLKVQEPSNYPSSPPTTPYRNLSSTASLLDASRISESGSIFELVGGGYVKFRVIKRFPLEIELVFIWQEKGSSSSSYGSSLPGSVDSLYSRTSGADGQSEKFTIHTTRWQLNRPQTPSENLKNLYVALGLFFRFYECWSGGYIEGVDLGEAGIGWTDSRKEKRYTNKKFSQ